MKLIKKWVDTKYNVENFLYENRDGLQVLHTLNKQALDTFAGILVNGGAYFEKDLEVPNGTAHFLEHILFSPNNILKSKREIDEFEFGNRDRARIRLNGSTGYKFMSIYGSTHNSRELDLFERLRQIICFPTDLIEKNVNREKKIIVAEYQHELKPDKDVFLQFAHFAYDAKLHNSTYTILGRDEKGIKSISSDDLIKFYKSQYTVGNSIFSIQSPNELTPDILKKIDNISKVLKGNGSEKRVHVPEHLTDEKRIGYFHNTQNNGISTAIFRYMDEKSKVRNYKDDILYDFRVSAIKHLGFDILREKKGYIYNISSVRGGFYTWDYSVAGFEITTDFKNLKKAIIKLDQIMYEDTEKFLKSSNGKKWFENNLSKFIFPHTVQYDDEYSLRISTVILRGYELYDFEKAKDEAVLLKLDDLLEYFKIENSKERYSYWIDSSIEIDEISKSIESIDIFKGYTTWKPVKQ